MRCFVVAGFLLTSASRGPSAIAEPLVCVVICLKWWKSCYVYELFMVSASICVMRQLSFNFFIHGLGGHGPLLRARAWVRTALIDLCPVKVDTGPNGSDSTETVQSYLPGGAHLYTLNTQAHVYESLSSHCISNSQSVQPFLQGSLRRVTNA